MMVHLNLFLSKIVYLSRPFFFSVHALKCETRFELLRWCRTILV